MGGSMIDESNLQQFEVQMNGVPIFPVDLEYIVYRADIDAEISNESPAEGDTPYLKPPDFDVWLKIVRKQNKE